jgi:hypothetical protein
MNYCTDREGLFHVTPRKVNHAPSEVETIGQTKSLPQQSHTPADQPVQMSVL